MTKNRLSQPCEVVLRQPARAEIQRAPVNCFCAGRLQLGHRLDASLAGRSSAILAWCLQRYLEV